jgi:two-component system, OmpR family, response regulator ResD
MPSLDRQRVLVVDDDPNVAEVVATYLRREGAIVEVCTDGEAGLSAALADPPDLMVLDLMLPGIDGLELCRRVQALAPVPVVMLTAKGDETERIIGLELGADDYVSKPFSPRELVARIKAVLRRTAAPLPAIAGPQVLTAGRWQVDVAAHEVRSGAEVLQLTAREFELLAHLVRHPRRAFRREELLERVWGSSYGDTSTVTVHVRRLREKVETDPSTPEHLVTVWGVGYRWEP